MPRITKEATIVMRVTAAMRTAIEQAADKSGRTLSAEAVQLLDEALAARRVAAARRKAGRRG